MRRVLIFCCALVVLGGLTACRRGPSTSTTAQPISSAQERRQQADYQQAVAAVIAPYWQAPQNVDPSALKQQLLDISVPRSYLDLHLQLVVAITALEKGEAGAERQLQDLRVKNPWLK